MRFSLIIALLATVFVSACGANKGGGNASDAMEESAKLVGIWKMHPLRNGIANIAEFTATGESRLHPYNCITKDQETPVIYRYVVDWGSRTIQLDGNEGSQTLKIKSISNTSLELSQNISGSHLNFKYTKGSDLLPLCGPDEIWGKERVRRAPYSPSDFVPDPVIPPHPDIDRYVGRWADEKGIPHIEVKRVADGSYQLNRDASENWTPLFNAVHWKGNELHFTFFAYANSSNLYDHPAHKSTSKGFLALEPDGISMKHTYFIGHKKFENVLTRK
jgi:hypothetical protein